jgi:hypothetical protein
VCRWIPNLYRFFANSGDLIFLIVGTAKCQSAVSIEIPISQLIPAKFQAALVQRNFFSPIINFTASIWSD